MTEEAFTLINRKLVALLEYIEEAEKLSQRRSFAIEMSGGFVAWQHAIRALPGVEFNVISEGDHIWMRVKRLAETSPPAATEPLFPWISVSKNPDVPSKLRASIVRNAGGSQEQLVTWSDIDGAETTELQAAWEQYQARWQRWAEVEKPRRQTITLYSQLFALEKAFETESSTKPIELVWGVGVSLWNVPGAATKIEYPLITQLVEITLDAATIAIEVRPREADPRVELDPYVEAGNKGVKAVQDAARAFFKNQEVTLSPFDEGSYQPVLRAAVTHLSDRGRYYPDEAPDPEDKRLPNITDYLQVTDTWALFTRKRGSNLLIDDLHRLKESLLKGTSIPEGPAAIVLEPSDAPPVPKPVFFRGVSYAGDEEPTEIEELYFPKPYNDEQVAIVSRLHVNPGVVVQGPPGTGKTHTIANVICHYLAHGMRVLVTSKGESALNVLRDQIPDEVRALTVSILTSEREGMKQFEFSIQKIASEVSRIDPARYERDIKSLRTRLEGLHTEIAATDHDIRDWARKHLQTVQFQGRQVFPEALAFYVVQREADYGWLTDRLLPGEGHNPQFTVEDIAKLANARRDLTQDLVYLNAELPVADEFADSAALIRIHNDLVRARAIDGDIADGTLTPLASSSTELLERAKQLLRLIEQALSCIEALQKENCTFAEPLREALRKGVKQPGLEALARLMPDIGNLITEHTKFVEKPVELPEEFVTDALLAQAVGRLSRSERPFGLLPFGKGGLKKKVEAVLVAGNTPSTEVEWFFVEQFIEFHRLSRAAVARWNAMAKEAGLPVLPGHSFEEIRILADYHTQISWVQTLALQCDVQIPALAREVLANPPEADLLLSGTQHLKELRDALSRHLRKHDLSSAFSALESLKAKVAGKQGPVAEGLRSFLVEAAGNPKVTDAELQTSWVSLLQELRRIASLRAQFETVERVASLIEESGSPNWARQVRHDPATDTQDPWARPDWLESWTWRRAKSYLEQIDGRHELRALQERRGELERDLSVSYGKLVVAMTWLSVFHKSTDKVKSALARYTNAIRHIGKGLGIRAVRYRQEAREAMQDAHAAVPCWIMPHWRVSESLPPEIGKFDLVIIDEASQSDLWALPSLLRGKKLMVVGDDKQVSPDGIGLEETKIVDLKARFLADQVFASEMTPEKSIYDLALAVFAGSQVMLREHFRCVEPIIAFSNRTFYNNEIRPLRIPKTSERLDPPLIDVFVKGGYRDDGSTINRPEARALVDEIKRICEEPAYKDRSIGVISLTGYDQANYIKGLIQAEIDPADIVSHNIEWGDARTFQGKEKHIMLLSMVAAPGKATALTKRDFQQRFNVAASRAKDRMYLFRSVELADLNPEDLRAKLISHFANPLQISLAQAQLLRDLCESGFEREMFDALTQKGYRVTPQVKVGAYRIDMVVEGEQDRRLAIECDGDKHHGPERWSEDMKRQRVLERAGWTFWRCFASTFTLQRTEVLLDLTTTLSRMGIVPIGAVTETVNRYTEHRVVEPAPKSQLEEEAPAEASEYQSGQAAKRNSQEDAFPIRDLFNAGRPPGHH